MSPDEKKAGYASRAGEKLAAALHAFGVQPQGWVCADLGCSAGGFVDCLLRHGAAKVYAVDRGYGVLAHPLRSDSRVVVMERTDALHVRLPERVRLVTIDVGWTRQSRILPVAKELLAGNGVIISLVKPHYEAPVRDLVDGVLPEERLPSILAEARNGLTGSGLRLAGEAESPIRGGAGNREVLWLLTPAP